MIVDDLSKHFGIPFTKDNWRARFAELDVRGAITQKTIIELLLLLIEKQIENEKVRLLQPDATRLPVGVRHK